MKIAVVTLHLLNNYGGLLQNFALQRVLKQMGHDAITIDFLRTLSKPSLIHCVLSWIKSCIGFIIFGKKCEFIRYSHKVKRSLWSETFVTKWIKKTPKYYSYKKNILKGFDAVVVGSDQVWRPKYNYRIEDMFLKFAADLQIKRVVYAASFGVDDWEYTPKQTAECAILARKINAVSVREESGVNLCKDHLGVDATWVLDPTLLLDKEDYYEICKEVPVAKEKFLAAYVLDKNDAIRAQCESIASERGLTLKLFEANSSATFTVPEWIAMFRDASYVVTDSFHGTVFSIIFGKDFRCLYNKSRGSARFDSLLKLYESGKLDEMRIFSLNWLKKALVK